MIWFAIAHSAFAATPSGTLIQNSASLTFLDGSAQQRTIVSNAVTAQVVPLPSTSSVSLMRTTLGDSSEQATAGPTQCQSNNGMISLADPVVSGGGKLDPLKPIALATTTMLHGGDAAFVQVKDADQNRDANVIDTVKLQLTTAAGDREIVQLSETGLDTGEFVGYIQTSAKTAVIGDCVLEVERNAEINSVYVDPQDSRDASRASALVDPFGLVFDSQTGQAVNGARVRLLDATTGLPAEVFGDDGVSRYPAEVLTGSPVTDAGGAVYTLPAGVFRFPLVTPGNYRVEVDPPAGRAFPSKKSTTELAQLSGGPFRLNDASFGAAFVANAPSIALDIPVDTAATQLFMQKSTATTVASVGDFVQYTLLIENTATSGAIASVRAVDHLPLGARYREGSTRIDGVKGADPQISADGQTLTFATPALRAGQRREIRYVVEITAGAHGKQLVNHAHALGPDDVASNDAQAIIQLRDELFRERAILMGRVVEGDCQTSTQNLKGIDGVRVYLEDGRYSVTDENGKYHFEDVTPGSHVVQMDTITIPDTHQRLQCPDRVRNAGSAYSQFVDVRGGALWRSDFVIARKPTPEGTATLQLQSELASAGIHHTLVLDAQRLELENARVMVMMPDAFKYRAGSATANGGHVDEPAISDGLLSFAIGKVQAGHPVTLAFDSDPQASASGGVSVKAVAMFDSAGQKGLRTEAIDNVLIRGDMLYESASYRFSPKFDVLDTTIQASDRAQLDKIIAAWHGVTQLKLKAIGHTDDTLIASRSQSLYPDNRSLSEARARAVADYLAAGLNIDASRITVEGRGSSEPIAKGHDAQSLALNRRVDIYIEGLRVVAAGDLSIKKGSAVSAPVKTLGLLSARTQEVKHQASLPASSHVPAIDIEKLAPAVEWLTPGIDDVPTIPSIKVAVQHLPEQKVELLNNGSAVSPLNFDGTSTNENNTVAVSRWRAIDLKNGDNTLTAVVRDREGKEIQRLTRAVHYSGGAVRGELVREASTLIADGRTHPVIALRMIDASGKPARPGTTGAFKVQAPYRSWWEVDSLDENKLVALETREPTFKVDADGLARLELEPTTQAGTAIIRLRLNERQQQEIRVWLEPQARDWILVGLAEGSAAYNKISDNMQSAADAGIEEGYEKDGRLAFFAKGAIKGEYLLTAAYDSAREHSQAKDKLLGGVEPDRFYTLYGDATEQRFEAATSRKLYVKVERRQFAAMFGDFETGLTITELSRYSRTLTGFKSDYAGEHFGYSAFAAESDQGYVKDELQGDGTSGLYRLTRRPIILNSDKVRLEVRDRFRSEIVVESRPLTRFIDYDLDYLNGTIFFKQPVPSRDENFNPVFIIAEYEVINGGDSQLTAGGRTSVKLADDKVEIGASYISEGATAGDTRVAGTDLRWQIAPSTELKAELARSSSDNPASVQSADAYLTELTHVSDKVDARVYVREQEAGFGVGQQLTTEAGTRKYGLDGRYRLSEHLALEGETYRQQVLDTGAQRDLVSAEARYEQDDYKLGFGGRHVEDTGLAQGDTQSQQAFVNGSIDLFRDLITLRASQDFALGGKNGSIDFPNRSLVGVDYHWRADTAF
ncbi:MAG TPA: OmpA family protein, partial [Steroidobacteraceae bacterium]|nr:OmpA family protein [Steroidobacteraceae bacterium]